MAEIPDGLAARVTALRACRGDGVADGSMFGHWSWWRRHSRIRAPPSPRPGCSPRTRRAGLRKERPELEDMVKAGMPVWAGLQLWHELIMRPDLSAAECWKMVRSAAADRVSVRPNAMPKSNRGRSLSGRALRPVRRPRRHSAHAALNFSPRCALAARRTGSSPPQGADKSARIKADRRGNVQELQHVEAPVPSVGRNYAPCQWRRWRKVWL